MSESIGTGIVITIPSAGEVSWDQVIKTALETICDHDHTGSGDGSQLSGDAFSDNGILGTKIRLANDEFLRGRNAANSADKNLAKINSSDEVEFGADITTGSFSFTTGGLNATGGTACVLDNDIYFSGRNAADSSNVSIAKINSSDQIELGTVNLVFGGQIASDFVPATDSAYDLGSSSKAFAEAWIDNIYSTSGTGMTIRSGSSGKLTFQTNGGTSAYEITTGGIINFTATMGNSTKDPGSDSPSDWVQIQIGGTTYYLAAWAA